MPALYVPINDVEYWLGELESDANVEEIGDMTFRYGPTIPSVADVIVFLLEARSVKFKVLFAEFTDTSKEMT